MLPNKKQYFISNYIKSYTIYTYIEKIILHIHFDISQLYEDNIELIKIKKNNNDCQNIWCNNLKNIHTIELSNELLESEIIICFERNLNLKFLKYCNNKFNNSVNKINIKIIPTEKCQICNYNNIKLLNKYKMRLQLVNKIKNENDNYLSDIDNYIINLTNKIQELEKINK